MPDFDALLESIKARGSRKGIVTADRYFREVQGCFDGGTCPINIGHTSEDQWAKALKDAERKLTVSGPHMRVIPKSVKRVSDNGVLDFDCIVTTPYRDRVKDILDTKGAILDKNAPLLWQHVAMMPIGKRLRTLRHNEKELRTRMSIADTALGRDAAILTRFGALRISHGFDPLEWEPNKDEQGWHFKKFEIFEISLVSIPCNIEAVVTSVAKSKWASPMVKGLANRFKPAKRIVVPENLIDEEIQESQEQAFKTGELPGSPRCGCKSVIHVQTKEFDVERQHLEAAKLEYDWISRFCSCEVKQLVNFETGAARIRMGSFLTGLKHATADSKEHDARRLTMNGMETPLEYETIQLNSQKSDHFLVDGISFRKAANGVHYAIKFVRTWFGERVEIYCAKKDRDYVGEFIPEAWKWANENNFLKGEAFSLLGEFLPKTSETWGDLFLDETNEKAVKRTVDLINAKGKACPNRGIVMMGPPGTGKTLSARLLRNHANATFIWVGGRDAYYFGGVGAITESFDLAKELAPAIIVMEDIDAALDSRYAIDVLKTEMDGIGRSTGITTIITTNFPGQFPEALLDRPGRFHDVLKFDLPSDTVRHEMLRKWLPDVSEKTRLHAVQETKGYSGAHLYELAQYAKTLKEQDEIVIDEAVTKALQKIADQRELINEELLGDRRQAGRRRDFEKQTLGLNVKRFEPNLLLDKSPEPVEKDFATREREYLADLAFADTAEIKASQRRVTQLLESREEREQFEELESLLSSV